MLDRLARAIRRPPAELPTNGGGLAWTDLYPEQRPAGIASRTYTPVRAVSAATASQVLADANPARRFLSITNDSAATLYVALAPVASTGAYAMKLGPGAMLALEEPDVYRGAVAGVWDAATGAARIAETT